MRLSVIQSVIMGFVSGLAELLPLSSQAHRALLRQCFGVEHEGPLFLLMTHIAVLTVVVVCMKQELVRLQRTARLLRTSSRRRHQQPDLISVTTIRHLRTAAVLVFVGRLLSSYASSLGSQLYLLSGAMVFSGILLWLPNVMRSGNKDSRNMSVLDGFLMGLGGAMSLIPGVSFLAGAYGLGVVRGVERRFALRFSFLLLIAALAADILLDLLAILGGGAVFSGSVFVSALCGAAFAAVGTWLGLRTAQAMVRSRGLSGFAYYCWGFALLCFILFLFL